MKTLVINTYGGSLLLGASTLGLEIIGSYEDTGFGLPIQQANFPHLNFIPFRKDWPAQDLSETFVIAHPPCSAFSVQNNNPQARGVNSSAFACTKSVLQYAMNNRAAGIAVESVVGALAGAWQIHQHYADTYGYNLYRILENGCMFGAQWRDRFWVVYLRKGIGPDVMPWTLAPRFQTVREVVGEMSGPSPAGLDELLVVLKNRFIEQAGCSPQEMEFIFNTNVEEMDSVDGRLWELKFKDQARWDVCRQYVTKYASSAMIQLAPERLSPVLLGNSWWYMDGRNLSEVAYKRLMGFPDDYIFPEGDSGRRKDNYRADMRTYLSKGVMPPIAAWVLENVMRHIKAVPSGSTLAHDQPHAYKLEIAPDMIADFRIRKKTWGERKPQLRHEDEHGIAQQKRLVPTSVQVTIEPPVEEPLISEPAQAVIESPPESVEQQPPAPKPEPIKVPRATRVRAPKNQWNAPELEDSLRETLFIRPHTADAYALHESHMYHRMNIRADDILLDLGGHIGCVASRAALIGAKVISIEPEPENFELLLRNTRTFPNVEAYQGAVFGGNAEKVELHCTKRRNDGGYSTGTHSVMFKTRGKTIEVTRVDFRELIEEYKPTAIKCNIEGAEFALDWSNLPPYVRSLGIEFHHRGGQYREKMKEIVQQLEAQNFQPVHRLNLESNFSAIIGFFERKVS